MYTMLCFLQVKFLTIKNIFAVLICLGILSALYQSSWFVLHHDIMFNTDIARDFLLIENAVSVHKLPLIGPRSGGIPGIFHGPLWLYINLPAFILSKGNPVGVGWFWVLLIASSIATTYFAGRKLFSQTTGLLSALLIAFVSITNASSLFNPYGAVILSPLFFLFFIDYVKKGQARDLLITLFLLGCIVQFQIAFGGPILILSSIWVLAVIFLKKKYTHLLSFFILLIPFSTYILFDLRHQFLEAHSLIAYISHPSGIPFHVNIVQDRLNGIKSNLTLVPYPSFLMNTILIIFWIFVALRSIFPSAIKQRISYLFFVYIYVGYWILTFGFRGIVWGYYYWPFLPMLVILFCASYRIIGKIAFIVLYIWVLFAAQQYAKSMTDYYRTFSGNDSGSWLFNLHLAQTVFSQHDKNFGYYVFSPDEFGYSPRYAMDYLTKMHPEVTVFPYKKESITYLLISPPGGKNNSIAGGWWKTNRVKISAKPIKVWKYPSGFSIEKYYLTPQETAIPSDPYLIDSIFFR